MEISISHRFHRLMGWLWFWIFPVFTVILIIGILRTGGDLWLIPLAILLLTPFGILIGVPILLHSPRLLLQRDGVTEKVLFRTNFYYWKDFQQAGVVWIKNRGVISHEIVMLKPGGKKREFRDDFFELKNIGKIVYIPYTEETLNFVTSRYGTLDFCLMNGQTEPFYTIEEISE